MQFTIAVHAVSFWQATSDALQVPDCAVETHCWHVAELAPHLPALHA